MLKLFNLLNEARKDEKGTAMVEYALLICLIALIAGTAVQAMGGSVSAKFMSAVTCLNKFSASC